MLIQESYEKYKNGESVQELEKFFNSFIKPYIKKKYVLKNFKIDEDGVVFAEFETIRKKKESLLLWHNYNVKISDYDIKLNNALLPRESEIETDFIRQMYLCNYKDKSSYLKQIKNAYVKKYHRVLETFTEEKRKREIESLDIQLQELVRDFDLYALLKVLEFDKIFNSKENIFNLMNCDLFKKNNKDDEIDKKLNEQAKYLKNNKDFIKYILFMYSPVSMSKIESEILYSMYLFQYGKYIQTSKMYMKELEAYICMLIIYKSNNNVKRKQEAKIEREITKAIERYLSLTGSEKLQKLNKDEVLQKFQDKADKYSKLLKANRDIVDIVSNNIRTIENKQEFENMLLKEYRKENGIIVTKDNKIVEK